MENIPFEDLKNNPILIFNLGCSYRDNLERWLHSQRINAAKNMVQIHLIPKAYSEISTIFIRRADNYVTKPMDKLIETIDHFHHIQNPADIDPLASVFKDIPTTT